PALWTCQTSAVQDVLIPGCSTRRPGAFRCVNAKEPAMSMIRDLRAVVRPASRISLRKESGTYDTVRDPVTATAVVDCAIYRDGRRLETEGQLTPQKAMRLMRRDG